MRCLVVKISCKRRSRRWSPDCHVCDAVSIPQVTCDRYDPCFPVSMPRNVLPRRHHLSILVTGSNTFRG